jgi:nucleoid-associated protein YgaU
MRLIKAMLAAIVLAALVVGPPSALVRFIGNPWPAEGVSLSAPITDGAIIGLLAAVVWVLWAQLTACIVVEAITALTDDRIQLRVPFTLGIQQHLARRLITAVVVATVATPVAAGTAMAATEHGPSPSPAAPTSPATSLSVVSAQHQSPQVVDQEQAPAAKTGVHKAPGRTTTVTVMRLDSLWSIAERHLGDGDRWPEIAALNDGHVMNDGTKFVSADHIKPGWELRVPGGPEMSEAPVVEHEVTVVKGDTLSEIALEELGDAQAYPKLFEASKDIGQPGGAHLSGPDLILPGWTIQIPGQDAPVEERTAPRVEDVTPPQEVKPPHTRTPETQTPEQVAPPMPRSGEEGGTGTNTEEPAAAVASEADEGGISALSGLLAAAGCLAVGMMGLIVYNRRRLIRKRPLGQTIAPVPADVAEVEQAILEHGAGAQRDVVFLDRALRYVAASCKVAGSPLPQLGAAVLGEEDLTLLFTQPAVAEVPAGWDASDDARAWMLPRDTYLEDELDAHPAPYPALVTIGLGESGHTWFLDLETLGMCGIAGEPDQVEGLTRFWVSELAVNEWAKGCEVLLAEPFGAEMIGLNPERVRQVGRDAALARAASVTGEIDEVEQNLEADLLTRRRDGLVLDSTNPVVVVLDARPEGELAEGLADRQRCRVVVVHSDEASAAVELRGDGTAYLPMWGISVEAFSMTKQQAELGGQVSATIRGLGYEPMPNTATDDGPLGKYARADGSLREEYTEPRHTEGGDRSSMLPAADEVYLTAGATTAEDLAALGRSVPESTRAEVAALDPTLDEDLADWFDESCPRPKVHLLGPVDVRALNGGDPAAIKNLNMTVSLIAYLACQERGVTSERVAADFGWKTKQTAENRASDVRNLLGKREDGSDWLPEAGASDSARRGGTPTYELPYQVPAGVLSSAELFLRLRNRAERRGDVGGCEEDLVTALSLITGTPFEGYTDRRFPWLVKTQRHDIILRGTVTDTAHILANRGVAEGRTDLVRTACAAARMANPDVDVAWLDEAAVKEAESGKGAADEMLRREVVDRYDEDLPERTETILDQRNWATG